MKLKKHKSRLKIKWPPSNYLPLDGKWINEKQILKDLRSHLLFHFVSFIPYFFNNHFAQPILLWFLCIHFPCSFNLHSKFEVEKDVNRDLINWLPKSFDPKSLGMESVIINMIDNKVRVLVIPKYPITRVI